MGLFTMFTNFMNNKDLNETLQSLSFKQLLEENTKLRDIIKCEKLANEILKDKVKELNKNNGVRECYPDDFSKAENNGINVKLLKMRDNTYNIVNVYDFKGYNLTKEDVFQMIEALLKLKTID